MATLEEILGGSLPIIKHSGGKYLYNNYIKNTIMY